ncbi:MAG: 50S ribosomal protein L25/general stress protein Ctc [Geminicoccaceae bacterium]
MSDVITLPAEPRERTGKGPNRRLRKTGRLPAVIYGEGKEPVMVHLEEKEVRKHYDHGHLFSTLFLIDLGKEKLRVLPREIQVHPVTDFPVHVDFLRASKGAELTVTVPVVFDNEGICPGLKRGGVLNIVRRELELMCPAESIPDEIHVDLAPYDINDSIHISQVKLPKGALPTITDRDFTIAAIVAPSGLKAEADEAAEEEDTEA